MISEEMLENLQSTRNIELQLHPEPDDDFLRFIDEIMIDDELGEEYEVFMSHPDLEEREKQAQCIIRQLKEFYRARDWYVYEREDGMALMLRKPGDPHTTEVWANGEYALVNLKIQVPVLVRGEESFNSVARVLHNFNQSPESWAGYFSLDDASGRIDYIYQYGFEDGTFTEEGFHRIVRHCKKAVKEYYPAIVILAQH